VIDSLGQPKPAWYELGRLHAPLLLGLRREGEALVCWAAYDNAPPGERAKAELSLRVTALADGRVLGRWTAASSVASGERRTLLRVEAGPILGPGALVTATFGPARASLLCSEPKELELPPAEELEASLLEGALVISAPTPLVDLWLWDEHGSAAFADNALTVAEPGLVRVAYRGDGKGLRARSLAGEHPLRLKGRA
jgi:hypothetical protein